ncbi:hypothetical protein [Ruegeria sp. EL01]|jgi:hypothetical protein|uniref:hypothetical protein n=1 Tax=Ruegeria sp. EL01 TaxID=2107578 RepID=UPI0013C4BCAB|nr:hypothetical protein [Ruegeria sp. EL01]
MSLGTLVAVIAIYGMVPLVGIGLSFFARSKALTLFLRYGGLYFGVVLNLGWLFEADCALDDFWYSRCSTIPQVVADTYSHTIFLNMVLYLLWAPLILILLLLWELRVRKLSDRS